MPTVNSLQKQIERRLMRSRRDVFLPRDFAALSDEDQVIRALRLLRTKREALPPKKHGNIPL